MPVLYVYSLPNQVGIIVFEFYECLYSWLNYQAKDTLQGFLIRMVWKKFQYYLKYNYIGSNYCVIEL